MATLSYNDSFLPRLCLFHDQAHPKSSAISRDGFRKHLQGAEMNLLVRPAGTDGSFFETVLALLHRQ